jgi:hypothetical protein
MSNLFEMWQDTRRKNLKPPYIHYIFFYFGINALTA